MTTNELRISTTALAAIARQLTERPEESVVYPAGLAAGADRLVWLVHSPDAADEGPQVFALGATQSTAMPARLAAAGKRIEPPALVLILGVREAAGHFMALCRGVGVEPLAELILVGPGMARIPVHPAGSRGSVTGFVPVPAFVPEVLSRTGGALGREALGRVRRLRVVIVGCGRSGSVVAESLAALGLAELTLIDPDRLELHNLGEMAGVAAEDVGQTKVEVLATAARKAPAAAASIISAVPDSVLALRSLFVIKPSDVIVSCPDSPAARLATSALAAAYLKPLLDIGTGILPGQGGRRMGADVRLVSPGRCLVCTGGVANLAAAREAILTGRPLQRTGDFRTERLGSLRSLNTLAVGLGQTLLEQYVAGRVRETVWLQADVGQDGVPRLTRAVATARQNCPLCRLTGRGDEGLRDLAGVLRQL